VGLGMFVGNAVGGRLADRYAMRLLYAALGALAVVLAVFTVTAQYKIASVVTLFLIGVLGFATVPPLQKRVMDHAAGAPTLASAVNVGAFNLGNAIAAWLGGLVIDAGAGYESANWVGAGLALAALGLAVYANALERRTSSRTRVVADGAGRTAALQAEAGARTTGVQKVYNGQAGQGGPGATGRAREVDAPIGHSTPRPPAGAEPLSATSHEGRRTS